MKALNGQNGDQNGQPSPTSVETYWVVDVFGQNDKVKRKSRRPPTYNPEDYAVFLRKVLGSTNANGTSSNAVDKLYGKDSHMPAGLKAKGSHSISNHSSSSSASPEEVRANNKQQAASDVSDVLKKLRQDLCFSFASFCKEFAAEPCDGITILMELLRTIQMAQTELNGSNKELSHLKANRRSLIRNASTDELEVLLCLYQLCLANGHVPGRDHGCARLLAHKPGFYGLALALVSNLTRTRSLALQLMTALCKMPGGHSRVSEALTTLRLNMGESVRLKLLSGIVNSTASRVESLSESSNNRNGITNGDGVNTAGTTATSVESSLRFLVEAMAFLNAFVQSAADLRSQVVIQWEVEEAALNIRALSQVADTTRNPLAAQLKQELSLWAENQINISLLIDRLTNVTSTNDALRKDLLHLRSRLQDLESEKKRFSDFETDMKKRCEDLENELTHLRSNQQNGPTSIASSLSIGIQTSFDLMMDSNDSLNHSPKDRQSSSGKSHMSFEDEESYSIDDVLEELNNIVNSAESDMNTENSTKSSPSSLSAASSDTHSKRSNGGSYTEEFVVSSFLPRPSTRSEMSNKTRSSNKNHGNKVQLDSDLCGETSDFSIIIPVNNNGSNQADDDLGSITSSLSAGGSSDAGPTEISRKKITRTFFGGGASDMEDDDDMEDRGRSYPDEDEENCRTTPEKKRNKVTRKSVRSAGASTTGGGGLRLRKADSTEHKIQPDILRTIPTRLFHHKSWDVLEARSPMYASDDMEFSGPGRRQTLHLRDQREEMMRMMSSGAGPAGGRRRHASVDNLTSIQQQRTSSSTGRDEMGPIFLHPTVHHPSVHQRDHSMDEMLLRQHEQQQRYLMEMPHQQAFRQHFTPEPEQLASHLGDLQVGDVFSFPQQNPQHYIKSERPSSRKSHKRDQPSADVASGNKTPKQPFALSNLLPGFLKSSFGGSSSSNNSSKSAREEWEAFHATTDKALMKDYRQNFHPQPLSVSSPVRHPNDLMLDMMAGPSAAEFWPPSFQAMPFRNIPQMYQHNEDLNGSGAMTMDRPAPLPSPTQLARGMQMHINRMTKLMDHPSGLY